MLLTDITYLFICRSTLCRWWDVACFLLKFSLSWDHVFYLYILLFIFFLADTSTTGEFMPWGKPGGGAPIRTKSGNLAADYSKRKVSRIVSSRKMFLMFWTGKHWICYRGSPCKNQAVMLNKKINFFSMLIWCS